MALQYDLLYYGQNPVEDDDDSFYVKNLTSYVQGIDKFTRVGNGEVVSAKVNLNTEYGDFITEKNGDDIEGNSIDTDNLPIIKPFDVFRLRVGNVSNVFNENEQTDDNDIHGTPNGYYRYLIQDDVAPQNNEDGTLISLDLMGYERYLQKMFFPGHFYFISFSDMVKEIISFYNKNKPDEQPTLANIDDNDTELKAKENDNSYIDIPDHTYGIFDFGESTSCYDALNQITDRLILSVAAGGAGQFYKFIFEDVDLNNFRLIIKPVGGNDTIGNTPNLQILEVPMTITELKEPQVGNIIVIKGQQGTGSIPIEVAFWKSVVEEYENLPRYKSNTKYEEGVFIRYKNVLYQKNSTIDTANPDDPSPEPTSSSSQWDTKNFVEYVEERFKYYVDDDNATFTTYSPWTKDRINEIKTMFGNSSDDDGNLNSGQSGEITLSDAIRGTNLLAVPDCNVIVRDKNSWRTWVNVRVTGSNNLITVGGEYRYGKPDPDDTSMFDDQFKGFYRGFRVLNDDTTGTGWNRNDSTATTDKNGESYINAIITLDRDGDWIVFRTPHQFDVVAILSTNEVWEYNRTLTGHRRNTERNDFGVTNNLAWRETTEAFMGNDCFHYPTYIANGPGLVGNPTLTTENTYDDDGIPNARETLVVTADTVDKFLANSSVWIEYGRNLNETKGSTLLNLASLLSPAASFVNRITSLFKAGENAGDTPIFLLDDTETLESNDKNLTYESSIYDNGWWTVLWESPFPRTRTGANSSNNIGSIYGGGQEIDDIDPVQYTEKVPVLDLNNLNVTLKGETGFDSVTALTLGPIDGIKLLFDIDVFGLDAQALKGNVPIRMTIEDDFDNVWKSDGTHRFQGDTQEHSFPISSFSIYRARNPIGYGISESITRILNPELKITEIFERRLIRRIKFQILLGNDNEGRYDPFSWEQFSRLIIGAVSPQLKVAYRGRYDVFHFTKTPIIIAKEPNKTRHIMAPVKTYSNISNVIQLKNIANADLTIASIPKRRWTTRMDGFTDIEVSNNVIFTHDRFVDTPIPDDDDFKDIIITENNDGNDYTNADDANVVEKIKDNTTYYVRKNTQKLKVGRITYSVGNRSKASGLVSTLQLYRRIPV